MERQLNLQTRLSRAVLLCMLLAAGTAAHVAQAQTSVYEVDTERVDPTPAMRSELDKTFAAYHIINIDVAKLNELALPGNTLLSMNTGIEEWMLQLQPFEIRTDDYEQRLNDKVIGERPPCPTFRGSDMLHPDRKVFALISPDYVAFCSKDETGDEEYYIDQLNVMMKNREIDQNLFVVYKRTDIITEHGTCNAPVGDAMDEWEHGHEDHHHSIKSNATQKCILVAAIETNTDQSAFFNNFGANAGTANGYMLNIINLVSDIYWNFTGIQLVVSAQNNYTSILVPWTITPVTDASNLLSSYSNWMNANRPYSTFNRTTSVLFSGKNLTSVDDGVTSSTILGLAYTPQLCSGYNINEIRPSNGQQVILIAHEIGHNFNGKHCDGNNCGPSPDCNTETGTIMCGVCCSNSPVFSTTASNAIRNYALTKMNVAGCFETFTRTLTTANDPNWYFGTSTGAQNLDFIYHTVQTSGTMVIGNNHSGITWNAGERFLLKPGFKAAPNAVGKQVKIGILPCDGFPGTGGATAAMVQLPDDASSKEPGGLQAGRVPEFKVYPNPTQQQVTLELINAGDAIMHIRWYDIYGRELAMKQVNGEGRTQFTFDLSPFANGMYILHVMDEGKQLKQSIKVYKTE